MKAKYRWEITQDLVKFEDERSAVGIAGPQNLNPELVANKTPFSLWDDDGECYYKGFIYGNFQGFEPLDDFGAGFAGCTGIKVSGRWL